MTKANRAIFLDRDGVIIENRDSYIRSWDDVAFIPGSLVALKDLSSLSYRVVIITNQSVVGRGIISLQEAEEINRRVIETIEREGGRIDAAYICPHAPQAQCTCRKPEPGMILDAQSELALELSESILIGDSLSDLLAGQAAGVPNLALVRTGLGATEESKLSIRGPDTYLIFEDLRDALDHIIFSKM